jgi:hypothetical protein
MSHAFLALKLGCSKSPGIFGTQLRNRNVMRNFGARDTVAFKLVLFLLQLVVVTSTKKG